MLYIKLTMTIPGVGVAIHAAELEEIDHQTCRIVRLVELAPDDSVQGAAQGSKSYGLASAPQQVVPHPSAYAQFEDIQAEDISAQQFSQYWQAVAASRLK